VEKGGLGVSSDYDTTQHAHAQKKVKRSGQAERSGEKRLGVFPTAAIQLALTPKKAKPSAAPNREKRLGVRGQRSEAN